MSKKEKVSIVRSDDFEEVDEALSRALASLEAANLRVAQLLDSETCSQLSDAAERKLAGESGQVAEVSDDETVSNSGIDTATN